jgi:hypothetical protein
MGGQSFGTKKALGRAQRVLRIVLRRFAERLRGTLEKLRKQAQQAQYENGPNTLQSNESILAFSVS